MTKIGLPLLIVSVFVVLGFSYFPNFFGETVCYLDDIFLMNVPQLMLPFSYRLFRALFSPGYHVDFYPVRELSYWLDIHIFGIPPSDDRPAELLIDVFHFHNFVIFILIGWVLFLFLRELKISKTIAIIVTSFYLLNPFHYEMVWWISARKDLLAVFFFICSALLWLRFVKQGAFKNALLCYLFFCLSLMSKTTFVLFPYALFVCHLLRGDLKKYLSWLTLAGVTSFGWGMLQRWHYSHAGDVQFHYPLDYRISASLASLGRMSLGMFLPQFNAIDPYNWGEWLALNHRFIIWGVIFWISLFLFVWTKRKSQSTYLFLLFFFAAYLPTSALIFNHSNFYSVRYFEASLLVFTIGLAIFFERTFQEKSGKKAFFFAALVLFCWFTFGLMQEKKHFESNISIIKKAMALTPGNIALEVFYAFELPGASPTSQAMNDLKKTVEEGITRRCYKIASLPPTGSGSLCNVFFSRGYFPRRKNEKLLNNEISKRILDWEAQFDVLKKGRPLNENKKDQWSRRVLLLDEVDAQRPDKTPYFSLPNDRLSWLAALRKIDPKSKEADTLQKEWEEMGVLFRDPSELINKK
jgi:hypothetical protein